MKEMIFGPGNQMGLRQAVGDPEAMVEARDTALLWRATHQAFESGFRYGIDLPVGAVVGSGDFVIGRDFASDNRLNNPEMHAENMALLDAEANTMGLVGDTLAVTVEPCSNCQANIACHHPEIARVVFALPRTEVSDRGLVRAHREDIFDHAQALDHPYEVVQSTDEAILRAGAVILDNVMRNPNGGAVVVNKPGLQAGWRNLRHSRN